MIDIKKFEFLIRTFGDLFGQSSRCLPDFSQATESLCSSIKIWASEVRRWRFLGEAKGKNHGVLDGNFKQNSKSL